MNNVKVEILPKCFEGTIRFTCERCGCVFEADCKEYEYEHDSSCGEIFSCDCPVCGRRCLRASS